MLQLSGRQRHENYTVENALRTIRCDICFLYPNYSATSPSRNSSSLLILTLIQSTNTHASSFEKGKRKKGVESKGMKKERKKRHRFWSVLVRAIESMRQFLFGAQVTDAE